MASASRRRSAPTYPSTLAARRTSGEAARLRRYGRSLVVTVQYVLYIRGSNVSGGQGTIFDERFLGRYAGAIMSDPTTALVELVANAWDAYATKVEIQWPDRETGAAFRIEDNGLGMSADEFEIRWRTLDYNRLSYQGATVMPPVTPACCRAVSLGRAFRAVLRVGKRAMPVYAIYGFSGGTRARPGRPAPTPW